MTSSSTSQGCPSHADLYSTLMREPAFRRLHDAVLRREEARQTWEGRLLCTVSVSISLSLPLSATVPVSGTARAFPLEYIPLALLALLSGTAVTFLPVLQRQREVEHYAGTLDRMVAAGSTPAGTRTDPPEPLTKIPRWMRILRVVFPTASAFALTALSGAVAAQLLR